jgi:hypothetical protein
MSIALDLALQLTLGTVATVNAAPPPPPAVMVAVRTAHQVAWGTTERFARNTTGWGFITGQTWKHQLGWDLARERAWSHQASWSLQLAQRQIWPWGLRVESAMRSPFGDLRTHRIAVLLPYGDTQRLQKRWMTAYAGLVGLQTQHRVPYGDSNLLRSRLRLPSGDTPPLKARFSAPWSRLTMNGGAHRSPYALTQLASAQLQLPYGVTDINPVQRQVKVPWAVLADTSIQAVAHTPELLWNGQILRILQATLSCDEDSPVWITRIELAERADFAQISIGDALTLTLGLESFVLIVDGKTLSRESISVQRHEITAVSPAAALESPFAASLSVYSDSPCSARETVDGLVADVVGSVQWDLDSVTSLSAARSIVAAIGGIVESAPDGTLICRARHPVRIPNYATAIVTHFLFDSDVLGSVARIAPNRGFNRVTLANEEGSESALPDRIEYVPDADDPRQGTVRAWLGRERAVVLAHTGHPDTVISSLGTVLQDESETLEFIDGVSSARYPVDAIQSIAWQHNNLGDVTADRENLAAAIRGYSLLKFSYRTRAQHWRVSLAADEEVQFVLIDA